MRDRVVFWQEAPSPHQAPFFCEVAALLSPGQAIALFQRPPTAARLTMGWGEADYGTTKIIMSSKNEIAEAILLREPRRSVHIFSSITHVPQIYRVLQSALADPRRMIGLLSEARDWRGLKGLARTVHSLWHERRCREGVDFVLAIGDNGVEWYRRCGYPEEKIFPFCYAVEPPGHSEGNTAAARKEHSFANHEQEFHMLFIGQLIRRKRVDLLLNAVKQVERSDVHLSIIGEGKERERLQRYSTRLRLANKVAFLGPKSNRKIRELLANTDLLVLPSRWDGWGAVVNEALMAGVPVICSDWCGASSLIRPGWNGDVFRSGSVDDLATVLRTWMSRGKLSFDRRKAIRAWSRCIAGPTIARYVLDVIAFVDGSGNVRPRPPWTTSI